MCTAAGRFDLVCMIGLLYKNGTIYHSRPSCEIITVPDDIGELDTNAPWIVRPGGRNFWEEIQFRDPSPDQMHKGCV